jgi:hypothetical protein
MANEKKKAPDQGAVLFIAIAFVAAGVLYNRCSADKPTANGDRRTPEKIAEDERKADQANIAARLAAAPPPTATDPARTNKTVTAADFGTAWPFTVSEGELYCLGPPERLMVVLVVGDTRYALNGNARESAPLFNFADLTAIHRKGSSVQGVIARGLERCPR